MKVKLSYIMAVGLAAGIGYWMSSGTVVVGGVGDGENAVPPPAERVAENAGSTFRVQVVKLTAQDRQAILEVRGRTEAEAKVAVMSETKGRRRPAACARRCPCRCR